MHFLVVGFFLCHTHINTQLGEIKRDKDKCNSNAKLYPAWIYCAHIRTNDIYFFSQQFICLKMQIDTHTHAHMHTSQLHFYCTDRIYLNEWMNELIRCFSSVSISLQFGDTYKYVELWGALANRRGVEMS